MTEKSADTRGGYLIAGTKAVNTARSFLQNPELIRVPPSKKKKNIYVEQNRKIWTMRKNLASCTTIQICMRYESIFIAHKGAIFPPWMIKLSKYACSLLVLSLLHSNWRIRNHMGDSSGGVDVNALSYLSGCLQTAGYYQGHIAFPHNRGFTFEYFMSGKAFWVRQGVEGKMRETIFVK